jgi:uncharacterized protein (DUF697 family)
MPGISQITSIWKNIKEFELAPIRAEALQEVKIAVVGAPSEGRDILAEQMRRDPNRQAQDPEDSIQVEPSLQILSLEEASQAESAELILLVLSETSTDFTDEQTLSRQWGAQGKKVLVFYHTTEPTQAQETLRLWAPWNAGAVLYGSAKDSSKLLSGFAPTVLKLLPDRHLALGRQFPLFRLPIARQLINDTSYTNAAYALGTGIAEVVPVLNLPLNITDMIVLTKAQAFLTYRLGLLLGFSTAWQDYLAEFGSVIGSGFIWRQVARYLVGLIPVWGIVPKVAVSYAGTYLVGNTILQWYLTGRHLDPRQARELYRQALALGKRNAQRMLGNMPQPRLRLPQRKKRPVLPSEVEIPLPEHEPKTCAECGLFSAWDAHFCQYCGRTLQPVLED